ncbi:MAG TPA: acyl-ACP desaturase [Verrucomicrobiota bacterium]|nr:acyl-ACP desaturase [Verrucomicrobiota bacterium]
MSHPPPSPAGLERDLCIEPGATAVATEQPSPPSPSHDLQARLEVLADLNPLVELLMEDHESKRELWFPSDLFSDEEQADPEAWIRSIRKLAAGLPDSCRVAIALNLVTEEGLPHFHRLLSVNFGDGTVWRKWTNLWTAEEDRHGAVLQDYCKETRIIHTKSLEKLRFEYLRGGFQTGWDLDPYRALVYTTLQERATQVSHAGTGRICAGYEPKVDYILRNIAADEARHHVFYRQVFAEILKRDPNDALEAAASLMPSIDMPGLSMPGFKEFADVVRRGGIYGPRDYLRIVQEQIRFWKIEGLTGLKAVGRIAQEKILRIPGRLEKIAQHVENRNRSKTFSFDLVFQREFTMA